MDSAKSPEDFADATSDSVRARSYQLEMLAQSSRRNAIVTMDTGSGKTEIAVMRMRAELDRCGKDKRIWFLAPTVTLCEQQYSYIRRRLPDASPIVLVGSSNIECWSTQNIWDEALHNHRVIVSTHAILLDALNHAFVKLSDIAMIVFDEAHHCVKTHPGSLIMRHYHTHKKSGRYVPHIMGLSASPIRRFKIEEIRLLEENLDSICITPRVHRKDLLAHVHKPSVELAIFHAAQSSQFPSRALDVLRQLLRHAGENLSGFFQEYDPSKATALSPRVVPSQYGDRWIKSISQFEKKAGRILDDLGSWASDFFICKTIEICDASLSGFGRVSFAYDSKLPRILRASFQRSYIDPLSIVTSANTPGTLSNKVTGLIDVVAGQNAKMTTGLIFCRERATVSVLARILSSHPRTAMHFRFSTFVGRSVSTQKRYGLHEMLDLKSQQASLDAFRVKTSHVIIATDVLEEGIDVAACNLVICFDPPSNLKSFIQRRGRARKQASRFVIFQDYANKKSKVNQWVEVEKEMLLHCQEEEKDRGNALLENDEEELDLHIQDPETGALLNAASIKGHLYHLCSTLHQQPFVESNPIFSYIEDASGLLTAKVTLPNLVGSLRRSYHGFLVCRTERAASQAAAHTCYMALQEHRLVNSNLLPNLPGMTDLLKKLPSTMVLDEQIQPWRILSSLWMSQSHVYETELRLVDSHSRAQYGLMTVFTPVPLPFVTRSRFMITSNLTIELVLESRSKASPGVTEKIDEYEQHMRLVAPLGTKSSAKDDDRHFVYVFDQVNAARSVSTQTMTHLVEHLERLYVLNALQNTTLSGCKFRDLTYLLSAIVAPSADSLCNYQRNEFLGDAIVKLLVAAQRFADYADWPPGWLSQNKDNVVSNASLANAALSQGFDRHVVIKRWWAGQNRFPEITSSEVGAEKRIVSTKILADTLQAVFAAAFLDSGIALARKCVEVFVPEISSEAPAFQVASGGQTSSYRLEKAEQLADYKFKNPTLLLQALTHPSCGSDGSEESYQRLAFLGDAVLGFIVSRALHQGESNLSEGQMTEMKHALTHSNMLGYVCMSHSASRETFPVSANPTGYYKLERSQEHFQLWSLMADQCRDLEKAQTDATQRYNRLKDSLETQLSAGERFPWAELAKLRPEKYHADLVQSLIGAIYVDSNEDLDECARALKTIGLQRHLDHIKKGDIRAIHPRSTLQHQFPSATVQTEPQSDGSFTSTVILNGKNVACASGCKTRDEAMVIASSAAIEAMSLSAHDFSCIRGL